jgi:hypothetical protein
MNGALLVPEIMPGGMRMGQRIANPVFSVVHSCRYFVFLCPKPVILENRLFYDIYLLFYYDSGTDFSGRFTEKL